jgi:hypothetical protein
VISARAWSVVTGETLVDGRSVTLLIFYWYRRWLRGVTGRYLNMYGRPLSADFRWVSLESFMRRPMTDLARDLESAALEAAAEAVDSHNPDRGPLRPWIKLVMYQRLGKAFEKWCKNEPYREGDDVLSIEGAGIDLYKDPASILEPDPIDVDVCKVALSALTDAESIALRLHAEGFSDEAVARELGLAKGWNAHRIIDRAKRKAQEALA